MVLIAPVVPQRLVKSDFYTPISFRRNRKTLFPVNLDEITEDITLVR
jgi:hypothetical protein